MGVGVGSGVCGTLQSQECLMYSLTGLGPQTHQPVSATESVQGLGALHYKFSAVPVTS